MAEEIKDTRKRYAIICPYCGKEQYACKSIAHSWGIADAGHGNCLQCGGFMKLIYSSEKDIITAEEWKMKGREEHAD